jgi:xanthine/uracil permease
MTNLAVTVASLAFAARAGLKPARRDIATEHLSAGRRTKDPGPRPYVFAILTAGVLLALAIAAGISGAAVSLVTISWTLLLQGMGFIAFSLKPRRTLELTRWVTAVAFALIAATIFAVTTYAEAQAGSWNRLTWQSTFLELLGSGVICELGAIFLMHRPTRRF